MAALVRGAGPAQLAVGVGEHDAGGVGVEQPLGRLDGLLQGGGQVLVGVQVAQGADALGQHGGVDRHERVPLVPVAELANPVNRPGTMMALECRSGPTAPRSCVGANQVRREITTELTRPATPRGHQGTCGLRAGSRARLGVAAPAAHLARRSGTGLSREGGPRSRLPASAGRSSRSQQRVGVRAPRAGRAYGPERDAATGRCASASTRPWPRSRIGPAPGRTAA
jgi:hypothetical protein